MGTNNDPPAGAVLTGRDAPPSHYLCKIRSFSALSDANVKVYTSDKFEAGGFKWHLSIDTAGGKSMNGKAYISFSLEMVDTSSLEVGWEVEVIFNFFIFNQLLDKYFGLRDVTLRRYHAMKSTWGLNEFIDLETFSNPKNGYLIGDTAVFGAEIFVVKKTSKTECLYLRTYPATYNHTWKVNNFSTLVNEYYESESFGESKWKILLYPKGHEEGKGDSISLFLRSVASSNNWMSKFILRVRNHLNEEHKELSSTHLFPSSSTQGWGWREYMPLFKLKDPKLGFLVDDTCIIEAEVTILGVVI